MRIPSTRASIPLTPRSTRVSTSGARIAYGIAVDGSGNAFFVVDTGNNRIEKFTCKGAIE